MQLRPSRVLIVAGSDSGGGAGIQADLKTVTMLGGHGLTAIAAITAQNSRGVQAVHGIPTEMVLAQIESVVSDFGVDAVKIGMIGAASTARAVAERLSRLPGVPIVFDPVMVATSGAALADGDTIAAFERFFDIAALVTPNALELAALGGLERLAPRCRALLVKGGHTPVDDQIEDHLYVSGRLEHSWRSPRIHTPHTHGTGCTLASAIATGLGSGLELPAAIERARRFVRLALLDAPNLVPHNGPLGHGQVRNEALPGPALNHIQLPAHDLAASCAFYTHLGLTPLVIDAEQGYARLLTPNGATLALQVIPAEAKPVAASRDQCEIHLEYEQLTALLAALQQAGFPIDTRPTRSPQGWLEARLRDPSGNPVCLYQGNEQRRHPDAPKA
jgi:hydroxymethylpyrimidine/phosphomethylpyrimidine kinase